MDHTIFEYRKHDLGWNWLGVRLCLTLWLARST